VRLLLDTHIVLRAAFASPRLPRGARDYLYDDKSVPVFSIARIWEIGIKAGLGKPGFDVDPRLIRRAMLDSGFEEMPVFCQHAAAVAGLPPIHKDQFDRLLVARYPAPVRLCGA
jgi:PIN domain nuclease of toxin-antitoxin system